MSESIVDFIRPGDRVTIAIPAGMGRHGQEYGRATGRAVMRGPAGWVLNMGGRYGTPGIASEENIIKAPMARKRRGYNPYIGHGVFKQEVSKPTWNRYFRENLARIRPELAERMTGGSFPRGKIAYFRDELSLAPGNAAQAFAQVAQNPKLQPFGKGVPGERWKMPYFEVLGRHFDDSETAQAFAEMKAEEFGAPVDIGQKLDSHTPYHLLSKVHPKNWLRDMTRKHGYTSLNPHGGSMTWGRHLSQMSVYKPVSQKTYREYEKWKLGGVPEGTEVALHGKILFPWKGSGKRKQYSIRADELEAFRKRGRNPGRRKARNRGMACPRRIPKRKWIQRGKCKGSIHKGKLHKKLQRWYGLSPYKKIPRSMLAKAYRRAQKRGDTKIMRQINLAKVFKKIGRKRRRKSRRR